MLDYALRLLTHARPGAAGRHGGADGAESARVTEMLDAGLHYAGAHQQLCLHSHGPVSCAGVYPRGRSEPMRQRGAAHCRALCKLSGVVDTVARSAPTVHRTGAQRDVGERSSAQAGRALGGRGGRGGGGGGTMARHVGCGRAGASTATLTPTGEPLEAASWAPSSGLRPRTRATHWPRATRLALPPAVVAGADPPRG